MREASPSSPARPSTNYNLSYYISIFYAHFFKYSAIFNPTSDFCDVICFYCLNCFEDFTAPSIYSRKFKHQKMLYLEDYLEMIEHLPIELRDRFTEMREIDLGVENTVDR